jgi:short-subunit dehydrogenase
VAWFEDHDAERDISTLIQVNLIGLMQVTREVLPHMLARGKGHIINMASVAGLMAPPLIASYSASKFGVRAFTDVLRREVAPLGIKVSGIYPGPASTEFGSHVGKNEAYRAFSSGLDVHMTSEYVARRVVDVAKRPRRSLIIPWWFRVIHLLETLFPSLMDWAYFYFVRKYRKLDKEN